MTFGVGTSYSVVACKERRDDGRSERVRKVNCRAHETSFPGRASGDENNVGGVRRGDEGGGEHH